MSVENKNKEEVYITWNVRGIIDKTEKLDQYYNTDMQNFRYSKIKNIYN
jgi:hypothetical protein